MANKIKLVRNDTLPRLKVTIYDIETQMPVNLQNSLVKMKIREPGADALKTTLIGTLLGSPESGIDGEVEFAFGPADLDTDGSYEAEYEVTFSDGRIQTAYHLLAYHNSAHDNVVSVPSGRPAIKVDAMYGGIPLRGNKVYNNTVIQGDIALWGAADTVCEDNILVGNSKIVRTLSVPGLVDTNI